MSDSASAAVPPGPNDPTLRVAAADLERLIEQIAKNGESSPGAPARVGPYRIVKELGRGSMGAVLLAHHDRLERDVALKILPNAFTATDGARERFLLEARAMARITHPNVVRIHDVIDDGGTLAIAMEHVEGTTLAAVVRALREARPERPSLDHVAAALDTSRDAIAAPDFPAFVARIGLDLAGALQAVHDAGLTHRDVKPSNVLVDRAGRARLADFGVVRSADATLTRTGGFLGTPQYAAPEQLRGDPDIDARADLYGLGATLYELLSLEPPVNGSPATILDTVTRGAVASLTSRVEQLPRDLGLVVHHALEPEAHRRYPSALAMAADLQAFAGHRAISVRPTTHLEHLALWAKREPVKARLWASLGLVAVVLLVVGGILLSQLPRIRAGQLAELRREYDELVERGYTAAREIPLRAAAPGLFQAAIELMPEEPIAIGGLALALAIDERVDDARAVLAARPELVEEHQSLRYLADAGVELLTRRPDLDQDLLKTSSDPLVCFFAALAARQRAAVSSQKNRRIELMRSVVELLRAAIELSKETPRIFRAELAFAAIEAEEVPIARRQVAALRRDWLDPPATASPSVAYLVATALDRLGDRAAALAVCGSDAFRALPGVAGPVLHARILDDDGQTAEALALLRRFDHPGPAREHVLHLMFKLLGKLGETAEADEVEARVLETLRGHIATADAAGLPALRLRHAYLDELARAGIEPAPEDRWQHLARRFPDHWRPRVMRAHELAQEIPAATLAARRALQKTGYTGSPPEYRAFLDLVERTRAHATAAADLAPYHLLAVKTAAVLLLRQVHDYEAALPLLERLCRIDPHDRDNFAVKATTHYYLGQYDAALRAIETGKEKGPATWLTEGVLGFCLLELGEFARALEAFARCEELAVAEKDPSRRRTWTMRSRVGQVLALVRKPDRSAGDVARARAVLAKVPNAVIARDVTFLVARGEVLLAEGDRAGAETALAAAERAYEAAVRVQLVVLGRQRALENTRALERLRELLR